MATMRLKCCCGAEIERDDAANSDYPDTACAKAVRAWRWEHRTCGTKPPIFHTSSFLSTGHIRDLAEKQAREDAIRVLEAGFCGEECDYGKGWDAAIRNRIKELRKVKP